MKSVLKLQKFLLIHLDYGQNVIAQQMLSDILDEHSKKQQDLVDILFDEQLKQLKKVFHQ